MEKTIETVRTNFNSVRTGRANPAILDKIEVCIPCQSVKPCFRFTCIIWWFSKKKKRKPVLIITSPRNEIHDLVPFHLCFFFISIIWYMLLRNSIIYICNFSWFCTFNKWHHTVDILLVKFKASPKPHKQAALICDAKYLSLRISHISNRHLQLIWPALQSQDPSVAMYKIHSQ